MWTYFLSGLKRWRCVTSNWSLLDSWADDLSAVVLSGPPQEPNLALLARQGNSHPATNIRRKSGRTHWGQQWIAEQEAWIWAVLNMTRQLTLCGTDRIFWFDLKTKLLDADGLHILPSGKIYRSIHCHKKRQQSSCFPKPVWLLKSPTHWTDLIIFYKLVCIAFLFSIGKYKQNFHYTILFCIMIN